MDTPIRQRRTAACGLIFVLAAASFALAAAYSLYFLPFVQVRQNSMSPTLQQGDLLILNRLAYALRPVQVGDVVVFREPGKDPAPRRAVIKRCVLVPNMPIIWNNNQLYIPYLRAYVRVTHPVRQRLLSYTTIPKGFIFVLGDNGAHSIDSRNYGLVPDQSVQGKAISLRRLG